MNIGRKLMTLALPAMMADLVFFGGRMALATTTCTFTTVGTTMTLDADCTTDATILIPNSFTLNGAGNTITPSPLLIHQVTFSEQS